LDNITLIEQGTRVDRIIVGDPQRPAEHGVIACCSKR